MMTQAEPCNEPIRCLDCQAEITDPLLLQLLGPFVQYVEGRTRCASCGFLESVRLRRLKPRPFRRPGLRPMKDGTAPLSILLEWQVYKAKAQGR